MSLGALDRLQRGEFRFPVAQDERFRIGKAADFADAKEVFVCGDFLMAVAGHYCLILFRFARKSIGSAPLLRRTLAIVAHALPNALDKADRRCKEIELRAQPVFKEALVAE